MFGSVLLEYILIQERFYFLLQNEELADVLMERSTVPLSVYFWNGLFIAYYIFYYDSW